MELSDIWLKIANNARLTPQEQDFLKMQGRETQMRNAFVAGNTTASGQLNVPMPFFPIFSETFATDKASITVEIPTGYKHLLFFGSMRTTYASGVDINCVINGDTGSNYQYQNLSAAGTTVTASTGATGKFVIGLASGTDTPAGRYSHFFAFMNSYLAPSHKSVYSLVTSDFTNAPTAYFGLTNFMSVWHDTAPVKTMNFSPNFGSIAAGSTMSIYGVF